MTSSDTAPERSATTVVRTAGVVAGSLLTLLALGLLLAGGVLLWADGRKDDAGFLSTGTHRFHTSGSAITTQNLDVDLGGAGWVVDRDRFGRIRLRVTSHTDRPIFVGIARTRDVSSYLAGSAHASVADIDYGPFHSFRVTYRDEPGRARPAAPARQAFWVASAHGRGTQTAQWKVRDGHWSVVVMNADGSRGVDAGIRAGADLPFLAPAGWISLGLGLVVAAAAAGLIVFGLRRPPSRPAAPRPALASA